MKIKMILPAPMEAKSPFLRPIKYDGFEVIQHFVYPFRHSGTLGMTIILTLFLSIFYFILKKLPGLIIKPGIK
jgi:hypothetical protein